MRERKRATGGVPLTWGLVAVRSFIVLLRDRMMKGRCRNHLQCAKNCNFVFFPGRRAVVFSIGLLRFRNNAEVSVAI